MIDKELREALAAPFPEDDVGWKPQAVKGNRALAVAYIDARTVMERLDDVFGPMGWSDSYTMLADGAVKCTLCCRLEDGSFISKEDVGAQSEQSDAGDRGKAAVSDALKRAAIKWGIGRYLYNLPLQWADYDPQARRFVKTPVLPTWARPGGKTALTPTQQARPANPLDRMEHLIQICTRKAIDDDIVRKWLDKANVQFVRDLPPDIVEKCIAWTEKQPEPDQGAA